MAEEEGRWESSLRLDTVSNSDRAVIIVRGDVDAGTAPQLAAVVESAVVEASVLELDLAELGFMDSTGLSVLVGAIRATQAVDGRVELSNVPTNVMRLLRLSDLLQFVAIASERSG